MRIRTKLLIASLLPVVLLFAVGVYVRSVGQDALRETIDREMLRQARDVVYAVDLEMAQRITEWKGYIETRSVQTLLQRSNFEFKQEGNIEQRIAETEAAWPDTETATNASDNLVTRDLRELLGRDDESREYGHVLITNEHGVTAAQTHVTSDYQQSDEAWWQRAYEDGLFISDVGPDEVSGASSVEICIRVDGDENEFLGVFKAVFFLRTLEEIVDSRSGVDSEHVRETVTLFTADRRVIRRSYAELKPLADGTPFLPDSDVASSEFTFETRTGDAEAREVFGAIAVSRGSGAFKGKGWFVSVERDAARLLEPINSLSRQIMLICGGAAFLCVALGIAVSRALAVRIDQLDAASSEVGAGNLGVQVEVGSHDELGRLAETFNTMSANLAFERNLLRTLMTHLPDAIYFKDVSGRFLQISQAFAERLGLESVSDAKGRLERDLVGAGLEPETEDDASVLTSGDASVGVIEQRRWPNGSTSWVSTTRAPLRDSQGDLIGTFGISHDVTSIKEAEAQLADVAARLALPRLHGEGTAYERSGTIRLERFSLRHMVACGSFIRGLSSECPTRDAFADELVRYLFTRLVDADGEPAFGLTRLFQTQPYETLDEHLQEIAKSSASEGTLDPETPCLTLLGSVGVEEAWNSPLDSAGHQAIPLPSVDVVQQLPMIAQLFHQLGFEFEELLSGDSVQSVGSLVVDDVRTGLFHIPEAKGSKYIPAQDFVEEYGIRSVVGFGDRLPSGDVFAVICFSRVPVTEEIGRMFSHLSISTKLALLSYDDSDVRVESQIMAVDQLLKNYEEVVCDQEARLNRAMDDLEDARDAADHANKAKSDFLANMSHEIRTPMNAIMGMTELVLDSELETDQRNYLTTVLDSADSLLTIINEILDFSKIEAGHLELESVPFDLRDVVGDIAKTVAVRAHRKGIELACRIDPKAPRVVVGDPARLRQVIVNLVGNAVKFTAEGEVVISVRCDAADDEQTSLVFDVRDTGVGIPKEKLATIFEAFQQADTSTTRQFGGTGLGLSISSTIVQLMGSQIRVKSEVGTGSQFAFRLQVPIGSDDDVLRSSADPEVLETESVLVIDDNETNRRILEEVLSSWGMHVTQFERADEALKFLRGVKAAGGDLPVVLTDVNMPGMDGYELCRAIRDDEAIAAATVIVLTSGNRAGDGRLCEELAVLAFLMKPVKQSELLNAVMLAVSPEIDNRRDTVGVQESFDNTTRPLQILLAEDGKANQKLAVGLLERRMHTVTIAENGADAVALWQSQPFDIVLMDVQMPETDGLEATRRIREAEEETGQHIPIVAMTAHALKGDRERCLESGMDGYVTKPIRRHELFDAIAEAVSGDPSVQSVPVSAVELSTDAPSHDGDDTGAMTPPSSAGGAIDWATHVDGLGGDVELLQEVVAAFLGECSELVREMTRAQQSGDGAAMRRAAHTIRGSMRVYEVPVICELAESVEKFGQASQTDEADSAVQHLKEELNRVVPELERFVSDGV